jgi:hypothetical protein
MNSRRNKHYRCLQYDNNSREEVKVLLDCEFPLQPLLIKTKQMNINENSSDSYLEYTWHHISCNVYCRSLIPRECAGVI